MVYVTLRDGCPRRLLEHLYSAAAVRPRPCTRRPRPPRTRRGGGRGHGDAALHKDGLDNSATRVGRRRPRSWFGQRQARCAGESVEMRVLPLVPLVLVPAPTAAAAGACYLRARALQLAFAWCLLEMVCWPHDLLMIKRSQ